MEIKKYENELSGITLALSSPLAKKASSTDVKVAIAKAMAKAIADAGQKANDDDVDYLMKVMPAEILSQVPSIRIDEIQIAINRGVYGHYGEYFGLNAVTFITFLKKYMESGERISAHKEFLKIGEPVDVPPTPEEVQKNIKNAIMNAYETFIEKGFYEDYGNFIYDKMDEMGLVALTSARKAQIFAEAKQSILAKKSPESASGLQEYRSLSSIVKMISDPNDDSGKSMIIRESKKMALQIVFRDFMELETDILEIMQQEQSF